jgi:hypothetical protein
MMGLPTLSMPPSHAMTEITDATESNASLLGPPPPREQSEEGRARGLAGVGLEHVAGAGDEDQLRSRDALGQQPSVRRRHQPVGFAVHHQRRRGDRRQLVPGVVVSWAMAAWSCPK